MKNSQVTFSSSAKIARTAELVTAIIFLPRYLISAGGWEVEQVIQKNIFGCCLLFSRQVST